MEIETIIQKYAMSVYTVSWVSGSAKDFAEGTDALSSFLQGDMVKSHTHGMKNHTHSGTTGTVEEKYGNANTGEMSGDTVANISHLVKIYWNEAVGSSRLSLNGQEGKYTQGSEGRTSHNGFNINLSHSHNFDHAHDFRTDGPSDNTTDSNNTSATENRPNNYTIRIWKRIA